MNIVHYVQCMNIAIFGAAGALGAVVAAELLARDHRVRLVGRNAARLRTLAPGAEILAADLIDPAGARAAAAGMDAILYAVGVPYNHFELHPPMTRTTLAAAKAAGVKQLIHISNVYPYGRPQTAKVDETHPLATRTRKGTERKIQEDLVLAAHDSAALRTLVLRPPDYYGATATNGMADYALRSIQAGKPADLLGPIDTPHEWVYVPDLAPVIADLFERPDAFGTAYNVAGPGVLTVREFATKLFAAAGKPLRFRVAGPLLLSVLGLFNPVMRELVEMSYLYQTPVLLDDTKLERVLGTMRKTSYDDGIRANVDAVLKTPVAA
jgi:nucleoside-diphosphate-sugar epimerase